MAGRGHLNQGERGARERRELIRRASYYSIVFFVAGVLVAVLGAALVALLLRLAGLPFLPTWLGLAALVIVVALVGATVQGRRNR